MVARWNAPAPGTAKLNSDASFLPDTGHGWGGAVARDFRGLTNLSVGRQLAPSNSPQDAEGQAMLIGLQAFLDLYRGSLVVETGCKNLAAELTKDADSRSSSYGLILDIKAALSKFCRPPSATHWQRAKYPCP